LARSGDVTLKLVSEDCFLLAGRDLGGHPKGAPEESVAELRQLGLSGRAGLSVRTDRAKKLQEWR